MRIKAFEVNGNILALLVRTLGTEIKLFKHDVISKMENLLSACLWQDGHSRVDPYLIHPHPLPQDYGYAIIAQFFFLSFFSFFSFLICFWCYYDFSTNDLHVFMNSCVWTMRRSTKYTSLMIHQKSFFFRVITIGWKKNASVFFVVGIVIFSLLNW